MKMPFGDLMQQAQQMQAQMQEKMQQMQRELAAIEVIGESGAGMVKVFMNGRRDVRRVQIDPSLPEESLEVLQDLVAAAVNDAVRRVEQVHKDQMAKLTGGVSIPGFDLPL